MKTASAELAQLQPPSEDGSISRALTELDSKIHAWTSAVAHAQDRIASDMDGIAELLEETAAAEARTPSTETDAYSVDDENLETDVAEYADDAQDAAGQDIDAKTVKTAETDCVDPDATRSDASEDDTTETDFIEADLINEPDARVEEIEEDVPLIDASTMPVHAQDTDDASQQAASEETGDVIDAMLAEFSPDVAERLKIMHATDESRRSMSDLIALYKSEMQDADELLTDMDPEAAQAIRVQYRLFNGRKSIRELIDAYQPSNEQQIKSSRKKKSWWRGQ